MKRCLLLILTITLAVNLAFTEDGRQTEKTMDFEWVEIKITSVDYGINAWHVRRPGSIQVRDVVTCEVAEGEHKGTILRIRLDKSLRPKNPKLILSATVDIPDFFLTLDKSRGIDVDVTANGLRDIQWRNAESTSRPDG